MIIKKVHIRYEDSVSIPGKTVAFGITMDSLSAQSCDANWSPGFFQRDGFGTSFKLLEMQNLAIYWIALDPCKGLSKVNVNELAVSLFKQKN